VNVTWTDFDPLAFIFHFCIHFSNASRLVCIFSEATPGQLSVANTAVSSAHVAVVDFVEISRSAVYSRCKSSHRTLSCSTPVSTGKSYVYSDSTFIRKCLLCRYGLSKMK
jgi:hypothetical protein